ncbi:hypothetical protein J6TS7_29380 [Paenibacillus dendritiformis]|uniref:hypothetical protein n=1 Tax=Paenibacillus TaxID=44249 RepID=UPI001B0E8F4C|nr:hypothetical protein [Paenibacillus dendritiformis]GIO79328.1 hypothetical protein J6TS7_29380 [Paenibacillus dendritiformis]
MKTVIEFYEDPNTGEKQVLDIIRKLAIKNDPDNLQLYKLILRGLEFLRQHGLQESFKRYFQTHLEDGRPYTIMLVKRLRNHVPLLEFRVNWKGLGAFRACFFEDNIDGLQLLVFTRAVIKQNTYDAEFERIAAQSEEDYRNYHLDPVGDDING